MKMLFEQITFHPAEAAERPVPLWQVILLDADAPRVEFDGTELRHPREVLAALDRVERAKAPRNRPIETEIRPLREQNADEPVVGKDLL
ncbi:hypothetical protein JQ596_39195 [Bradyrhizobium manausense]|uniref:hypothetical protein n=1 Tax=Bradyrhizobium manausense TaxID=989370 RepID=UPI001BA7D7FC|nr:hypothetical protein [Bradyrhizobium manausense]MBR0831546.1 hypothetical protein [Bradyrhizobium manausense]